jgi:hypothetical protein
MTSTKTSPKTDYLTSTGRTNTTTFEFWIVGDMPLITHAWSAKARGEMLGKQKKTAKAGRDARDPEADFLGSLYLMGYEPATPGDLRPSVEQEANARQPIYGFPVTGIKNSILSAAHKDKGIPRTEAMAALFFDATISRGPTAKNGAISDLPVVRIWGAPPEMREDMVRIGAGLKKTANLAYRPQFWPWAIKLTGQLNTKVLSRDNLIFLINEAGISYGIGDWRNERKGIFGSYHLATPEESALWDDYTQGGAFPKLTTV